MYELPTSIELSTGTFNIRNKGDFRVILDCFNAINDIELTEYERLLASLIIFFEDMNEINDLNKLGDLQEASKKVELFYNCGQEKIGAHAKYKLLDWEKDSSLISSAINNVAKIEIRNVDYMHWWTFMGYYLAIGECPLSHIIGIRRKLAEGKKLEKYESKFRMENPEYFTSDYRTNEEKELEQWFLEEVWNKK